MKKKLILSIIACSMIMSCSTDEVLNQEVAVVDETGLSALPDYNATDSRYASKDEIANVIGRGRKSRSAEDCKIDIIKDSGAPVAYVVNYGEDEGWQIISARKDYYPVLAYNDRGYFNINDIYDCGVIDWVEALKEDVRNIETLSEDSVKTLKRLWRQYETQTTSIEEIMPTATSDSELYYTAQSILMDSISKWQAKHYELIFPDGGNGGYSQEWIDQCFEYLRDATNPIYEEWWRNLVVLVRKEIVQKTYVPNFVATVWDQINGFNNGFPKTSDGSVAYAGCGPVAVGQVMKYYEYPTNYDWENMPNLYATETTSKFLYDVGVGCKADFTKPKATSTLQPNIEAYLKKKGYSYSKSSLINTSSLERKSPIMLFGLNINSQNNGHVWLLTGLDTSSTVSVWEGYAFITRDSFVCANNWDRRTYSNGTKYFVNWGWGVGYNAFYEDCFKGGGNEYTLKSALYSFSHI